MRFKVSGIFQEEQRKGFIVTHQISKEFDNLILMSDYSDIFLQQYNSKCCHHLKFNVEESNAS